MALPPNSTDEILISRLEDELYGSGFVTPDPAVFHGAELFAMEIRRIFFANWTLLDYADRFTSARDCRLYDVAMRSLVVVRSYERQFHALRNRCLHAAYPVILDDQLTAGDKLTCAYHGWQYALDGKLLHAPHVDAAASAGMGLARYGVTRHGGLLYLQPVSDSLTSPAQTFIKRSDTTGASLEFHVERISIDANWKKLAWVLHDCVQAAFEVPRAGIQIYGAFNLYINDGEESAIIRLIPVSNNQTKLTITQTQPSTRASRHPQVRSKLEHHLRTALSETPFTDNAATQTALAQFNNWYLTALTSCTPKETNE